MFWHHKERVIHMRNLASVYKSLCDFSGSTTSNYKGFTWQVSPGKLPSPHQTWGTATVLHCVQSVRGVQSRIQGPLAGLSSHICIPGPGTSFLGLYLRPWAVIFCRCLCWGLLLGTGGRKLEGIFNQVWLSTFPLLAFPLCCPPNPKGHKTGGAFVQEPPQHWADSQVCANPLNTWLCAFLGRKIEPREWALFRASDSCSCHSIK